MRIASFFKLSSAAVLSSVIGAAVLSSAAHAHDQFFHDGFLSEVNWQVEPYIGADAMVRNMRYKNEPTHPFQEHLDTFQPFVGVRLHKFFGIEAGYQQSEKGTKERFFHDTTSPAFLGGGPLDLSAPFTLDLNTTTQIRGWNFGLMGFYPICKDTTEIFAKIAYGRLALDSEISFRADQGAFGLLADNTFYEYQQLHRRTSMAQVVLGVKQMFNHHFGGRMFVGYDRTSRIKLDSDSVILDFIDPIRTGTIKIRPHNSWNYGVGVFYTWR